MTYEPTNNNILQQSMTHLVTRQSQEKNRSASTGLKPATAVRLKSLPWNFAQLNSDTTTATSHSRRTMDNLPAHKFQSNFSGLEGTGTKPSTGSTNVNGFAKVNQDGAVSNFVNRSKEEDVFGNMK